MTFATLDFVAAYVDLSSTSVLGLILSASVMGSTVAVLVWVLQRTMGDRAMARWFYLLWLMVLFRFLLLAAPESPTSVMNLIRGDGSATLSTAVTKSDGKVNRIIFAEPNLDRRDSESGESRNVLAYNPSGIALTIWAIGICLVLFRLAHSCIEARQLVRCSTRAGDDLALVFSGIKKKYGFSNSASIRVCNRLESPAMVGLFRPVVLVPNWCQSELTSQQLRFVLIHELVHIQRRDNWIQLLACLAQAVHWFNPFVWYVSRSIESSRELACDQTVISICSAGASHRQTTRDYGATILQIATRKKVSFSVPALVGPFINANNQLIRQRIAMLVNSNQRNATCKFVLATFLMVVVAAGFTSAQTLSTEPAASIDVLVSSSDNKDDKADEEAVVIRTGELYSQPVYALKRSPDERNSIIAIAIDQSRTLEFDYRIPEALLTREGIIEVEPISPDQLRIHSLQTGTVELQVFDTKGKKETLEIKVLPFDEVALQKELENEFPGYGVRVQVEPKQIILWGGCSKSNAGPIVRWFTERTDLDVVNQMIVDPIAVEINVYEVSKTKLNAMGFKNSAGAVEPITSVGSLLGSSQLNRFSQVEVQKEKVMNLLEKLRQQGVAQNTDNPVLVMAAGRPGEFLRGGEIPFAKVDEEGKPQVEFRSFGIKVQVDPVGHCSDGVTVLNLKAELTDLGAMGPDGVPQLNTRRINMAAELKPGKSICFVGDYQPHNRTEDELEVVLVVSPRKIKMANE